MQPDAHKYAPLFLPSRAFQLGGFVLVAPPHVALRCAERERERTQEALLLGELLAHLLRRHLEAGT